MSRSEICHAPPTGNKTKCNADETVAKPLPEVEYQSRTRGTRLFGNLSSSRVGIVTVQVLYCRKSENYSTVVQVQV